MPSPAEDPEEGHIAIGANALLLVFVTTGALLGHLGLAKFNRCTYLPESATQIVIGMIIGAIINFSNGQEEAKNIIFNPEVFFFVILPPIIFEAGFTMQKTNFFSNMTTILLFAVVGTVISTLIVGFGLFSLAAANFFRLDGTNPLECLMFAALISAVDPVATLAILGSKRVNADPVLYSIVFGESVLNDAVSIVLFNTFKNLIGKDFTNTTVIASFGSFIGVSLGSIVVGVLMALSISFLFKRVNFAGHDDYEFIVVFFGAYATYCLAEILELSGIMALFFCGILMGHYCWYNLQEQSRTTTKIAFKGIATVCETFLFIYLGITSILFLNGEQFGLKWNGWLIIFTLILCIAARGVHIYGISWLVNFRRKKKITKEMKLVMWFSGLRGAIAFALAMNVPKDSSGDLMKTTTMTVVILTTLVCGVGTLPLLKKLGIANPPPAEGHEPILDGEDADSEENDEGSGGMSPGSSQPPSRSSRWRAGFHNRWRGFDRSVMQVYFGGRHNQKYEGSDDRTAGPSSANRIEFDENQLRVIVPSAAAPTPEVDLDSVGA